MVAVVLGSVVRGGSSLYVRGEKRKNLFRRLVTKPQISGTGWPTVDTLWRRASNSDCVASWQLFLPSCKTHLIICGRHRWSYMREAHSRTQPVGTVEKPV